MFKVGTHLLDKYSNTPDKFSLAGIFICCLKKWNLKEPEYHIKPHQKQRTFLSLAKFSPFFFFIPLAAIVKLIFYEFNT